MRYISIQWKFISNMTCFGFSHIGSKLRTQPLLTVDSERQVSGRRSCYNSFTGLAHKPSTTATVLSNEKRASCLNRSFLFASTSKHFLNCRNKNAVTSPGAIIESAFSSNLLSQIKIAFSRR